MPPTSDNRAPRWRLRPARIVSGSARRWSPWPPKERELLTWLFFEGRDKDQICRDLEVDRDYLRVLLHRAKNHFREQLAQQESE